MNTEVDKLKLAAVFVAGLGNAILILSLPVTPDMAVQGHMVKLPKCWHSVPLLGRSILVCGTLRCSFGAVIVLTFSPAASLKLKIIWQQG